jgi:hypothetical protein
VVTVQAFCWISNGFLFLLGQEWEEKLSQSNAVAESFKKKYQALMETMRSEEARDKVARSGGAARSNDGHSDHNDHFHDMSSTVMGSVKSAASKAETVASGVSGLAQQARSLVMNSSFNCVAGGGSGVNGNHPDDDYDDDYADDRGDDIRGEMEFEASPPQFVTRGRSGPSNRDTRSSSKSSEHRRFYSRSPHRVDI